MNSHCSLTESRSTVVHAHQHEYSYEDNDTSVFQPQHGGRLLLHEDVTGKQDSKHTQDRDKDEAFRLVAAKNENEKPRR